MNSSYLKIFYALLLITTLVAIYFVLINSNIADLFADMELLITKAKGLGVFGPLLLIGLIALAIVFNPLPSAPVAIVAGAVYGHVLGTVYIVIGAEIGAIVAFLIARTLGYGFTKNHLGDTWSLGRFGTQNALTAIVFVSRLVPFMSFDLVSYAAGLTVIRFWRFALATLLGLMPVSFALAHLGGKIIDSSASDVIIIILLIGLLTLVPLLISVIHRYRRGPQLNDREDR